MPKTEELSMKIIIERWVVFCVTLLLIFLYYSINQYLFSFLALCLFILSTRFGEVKSFSVSLQGVTAVFKEKDNELKKIISSKKSTKDKVKQTESLIDEVFALGYQAAGGRFNTINNVIIKRDQKGNIVSFQYGEN